MTVMDVPKPTPKPTSAPITAGWTNSTEIREMLRAYTNVALIVKGSTCTHQIGNESSAAYGAHSAACESAFDGVYDTFLFEDTAGHTRSSMWIAVVDHPQYPNELAPWIKVTFQQAADVKYMGIFGRDCPADRWTSARVEGSASQSVAVNLDSVHQYSLYEIDLGTTTFAKFLPTGYGNVYRPGVMQVEYWASTTDAWPKTCPMNPYKATSDVASTDCIEHWNNYIVNLHATDSRLSLAASNINLGLGDVSEISAVVPTAGWSKSSIAFKVRHYPVRGTIYGDCRADAQGHLTEGTFWAPENKSVQRTCTIVKWTACNAYENPTCKVKKHCEVQDLATVVAEIQSGMHHKFHSYVTPEQMADCMQLRCYDQCSLQ